MESMVLIQKKGPSFGALISAIVKHLFDKGI